MKVLFNTQPAAFQSQIFGGAEIQLLKTKEYLEKLGVKVKFFDLYNDKVEDFDILHNFGMSRDTNFLCNVAKKMNTKIALSSIYWPPTDLIFSDEKVKGAGKIVFERMSLLETELNPFSKVYPYKNFLKIADVILPNSETEKDVLVKRFKTDPNKILPVPNGVDKKYLQAKPDLFFKNFKTRDFVLYVGRIDPRKNLLKLVRAMRSLSIPLVILGNPAPSQVDYLKQCKKEAHGSKISFIKGLPKDDPLLISAYAAAKTLVLPSWYETPGLVALEAGLAGCNIAITSKGSTKDYFGDLAEYCNPTKISSIKNSVLQAHRKKNGQDLRNHILNNFTWEAVAEKTLSAYKKIYSKK